MHERNVGGARKQLAREQSRQVQRIQKTLEEANIKLAGLISDIMGLSGRRMIEAMIAGPPKEIAVRNPPGPPASAAMVRAMVRPVRVERSAAGSIAVG